MGHKRLGRLPRSAKWKTVVSLIAGGADVDAVAQGSAGAAEGSLRAAADDETFARAFWLLTQIPQAAHHASFSSGLAELGLETSPRPGLPELVAAFTVAVDRHVSGRRSDLGEMAQIAAAETLAAIASHDSPTLFGISHEDVRLSIAKFAASDRFSVLARDFFARITARSLEYFLSRELSNHVGLGRRLATVNDASAFRDALELHCRQASRIIQEFSSGWLGRKLSRGEPITHADARRFVRIAFKKMTAELRMGRDAG